MFSHNLKSWDYTIKLFMTVINDTTYDPMLKINTLIITYIAAITKKSVFALN
jgi:hypothetical protein